MQPDSTPLWRKLAPFAALLAILTACNLLVGIVVAQTTNGVESVPTIVPDLSKFTQKEWLTLLISLVTPPVVTALAKIGVPARLLPFSTPLIGIVIGFGLNWAAGAGMGGLDMLKAGALSVFVRESWKQAIAKTIRPEEATVLSPKAWDEMKMSPQEIKAAVDPANQDATILVKKSEDPQ